jgi:hypothetical protein
MANKGDQRPDATPGVPAFRIKSERFFRFGTSNISIGATTTASITSLTAGGVTLQPGDRLCISNAWAQFFPDPSGGLGVPFATLYSLGIRIEPQAPFATANREIYLPMQGSTLPAALLNDASLFGVAMVILERPFTLDYQEVGQEAGVESADPATLLFRGLAVLRNTDVAAHTMRMTYCVQFQTQRGLIDAADE